MSARSRLIDAATLAVADGPSRWGCSHIRKCGCRGKRRIMALAVVATLLDAGWTLTPPEVTS